MILAPPRVEMTRTIVRGRRVWRLLEDYHADIFINNQPVRITVSAGAVTDMATIPRWLHWLIPPDGLGGAAIIHDRLCEPDANTSRFIADAIFRELMRADEIPWYKAIPAYVAVRGYAIATGTR